MAVSVRTMHATDFFYNTYAVAAMQVLRFYCSLAGGTFCYNYVGGSFCCNYAVGGFHSTYADDSFK